MSKETSQRIGIEGVHEIKEWIEATTRFAFTFSVYDNEVTCTRICLNGDKKAFDLEGISVPTKDRVSRPISVECKKYSTVGHQGNEYRKFLAIAYSDTANTIKTYGHDAEREYMWITTHPFSQTRWPELLTLSHLRECVEENKVLVDGQAIDDDLLAKVAARIWVMVVGQKQIDIRLTRDELAVAERALKKEGYRV
ncbi:hypothetical protein [Kribbella sp. CA-294648]|uniref:hypothetical protein n=1 Tax=Kribbella sp. CA-294648 TaxID=3239948 RepID=UPI003D927075